MPYNSLVSRSDATALIPEDMAREIIKGVKAKSLTLQLFRHKTMSRAQQRMPVISALPTAYFVSGDTGTKQTTEVNWTSKYLDAEEMACIVPIPEKVLDDVDYDMWAEIKPEIEEALAVLLDAAILFGTSAPASWPTNINSACSSASHTYTEGTSGIDVMEDLNQTMAFIEADGYAPNGFICRPQFKSTIRGLRDLNNQPIAHLFSSVDPNDTKSVQKDTLNGEPAYYSRLGLSSFATGSGNPQVFVGDWNQGIIGIRQDITYKLLDQAVLTDNAGAIIYNLPQQDMVALRVVCRYAWQIPNPINRMATSAATRYPFAVLLQT